MKEHPDCQPRRAVPVNRGNYNNGDADQEFECKRIYKRPPELKLRVLCGPQCSLRQMSFSLSLNAEYTGIRGERREILISLDLFYGIAGVNPCACAARDIDEV